MSKNQFKILVVFSFLIVIAQIATGIYEEEYLPAQLQLYLNEPNQTTMPTLNLLTGVIDFIGIVSILLLLTFKAWSRHLYAFTLIFVTLNPGITVLGKYTSSFVELQILLNGIVLGLIYFSEIKQLFLKKSSNTIVT